MSSLIGVLAFFRVETGANVHLCIKAWTNSLFLVRCIWFWWNSQDDHSPLLHIQRSGHYQWQDLTAFVPRLTKTSMSYHHMCSTPTFFWLRSLMWLLTNSRDTSRQLTSFIQYFLHTCTYGADERFEQIFAEQSQSQRFRKQLHVWCSLQTQETLQQLGFNTKELLTKLISHY